MGAAFGIIVTPVIIVQHLSSEDLRLLRAMKGARTEAEKTHTLFFAHLRMNCNQCSAHKNIILF